VTHFRPPLPLLKLPVFLVRRFEGLHELVGEAAYMRLAENIFVSAVDFLMLQFAGDKARPAF
jgi:hypothetical protein